MLPENLFYSPLLSSHFPIDFKTFFLHVHFTGEWFAVSGHTVLVFILIMIPRIINF